MLDGRTSCFIRMSHGRLDSSFRAIRGRLYHGIRPRRGFSDGVPSIFSARTNRRVRTTQGKFNCLFGSFRRRFQGGGDTCRHRLGRQD